ncbi:hypothetical protein [Nocardioides dongxiaopingii]|uniref:hypothetical protein n=1 Tax=Nocardioides dongxiaopingii TaxID=2576036 RepID=UPI0010C76CFB|nr:hypothetical protein [Nocardioides dongxiaopingii]
MELHEHLYDLGVRRGDAVFDDADVLRGALEGSFADVSTAAERGLLVDAVRSGVFGFLVDRLVAGVPVDEAVGDAGDRLARVPGGDPAAARWACAALAYAVGRADDADVRRHPRPGAAPGAGPGAGPEPHLAPDDTRERMPAVPALAPTSIPVPVPAPVPLEGREDVVSHAGSRAERGGARRRWPVVAAAVLVLALVAGVVAAVVLGGDEEPAPTGGGVTTPSASPSETETETIDPDGTDPAAVNARYSGLAEAVVPDDVTCTTAGRARARGEKLTCELPTGTLELVTYPSAAALEAAREERVEHDIGTVYEATTSGTLMAFEREDDAGAPVRAAVYWDDAVAQQSATLTGPRGTDLDDLVAEVRARVPSVAYPTGPSAPGLVDFLGGWLDVEKCLRIETAVDLELEESFCDPTGPVEVFVGRFESEEALEAYRALTLAVAKDSERPLRTWEARRGKDDGALYEYTTAAGRPVRYWDLPGCACYAEATLTRGDADKLATWWRRGPGVEGD